MVTKSLNDIPYEIYFENFIPVLEIKEIGILSMVSPTLNSILSNNEFWKQIYFKTTKKKIVETSVHIGPYSLREIKNKRRRLYRFSKFKKNSFFNLFNTNFKWNSFNFLSQWFKIRYRF